MATRAWTPRDLGSALAFFVTGSDATVASSKATSIKDSVSGLTLSQVTTTKQPTYSATAIGGKPGLIFTGTQFLSAATATGLPSGSSPSTMFIVYKGTTATGSNEVAFSWGAGNVQDERLFGFRNNGPYPWWVGVGQTDAHGTTDMSAAIASMIGLDSGGASNLTLYQDGTQVDASTGNVAMSTTLAGGIRIGTTAYQYCNPFIGTIGVIGVVNRLLTTSERQQLEGWMAWTYGSQANLPANHPYKSAAPTVTTGTTVNPSGIASTNAFGAGKARLRDKLVGLASTVAFGTDKIRDNAKPAGLASTNAFGAPRIAGTTALTPGTYGAGAYGSGDYSYTAARPAGLASTNAFGVAKTLRKAKATGRAPTVLFGSTRARLRGKLTGLVSTTAYGAQRIRLRPKGLGRASTVLFGTDRARIWLHPGGRPAGALFGAARGRVRGKLTGLGPTFRVGAGLIRNKTGLDHYPVPSLPSTARYGAAKTHLTAHVAGVPSRAAFGYVIGVSWTGVAAPGDGWQAVPGVIGNWTDLSSTPGNWS